MRRIAYTQVLASVDELFMDYDGSDTTKDKIKRITITLNEKLATLKGMLLKRGTGSGEWGTGNGSLITSSQRYPP